MVVYPSTAEHVAQVLGYASEHELAVIPCRNATTLDIGNPPSRYDLALSLKEMNRVWHYEPDDLTVSVEPGMKFGDLQHFLARRRLWLPLDPPGGDRASLGGILSTNAAGPLRIHYGAPRDMTLGMKIATTDGKVIKTGGRVVKNVAGYDLAKVLIGSYGTLGVIVEACLKLFPLPAERATFAFTGATLGMARDLRRGILNSPLSPLRLVFIDAEAVELLSLASITAIKLNGPQIWVEVGGSSRVVERCEGELAKLAHAAGAPLRRLEASVANQTWAAVAELHACFPETHPGAILLRASMALSAFEEFVGRAEREAESEKMRLAILGQPGVGVIHLLLSGGSRAERLVSLIGRLRLAAGAMGGILVAERCPAQLKAGIDVWGPPGDDFEVMRKLKAAWDPKGVLAPGRYLGGI